MANEPRDSAGNLERLRSGPARPEGPPQPAKPARRGRPFPKGRSGNPAGRPRGSRNSTTLAAEALLLGEAEALTRMAVGLALSGDKFALGLCLDRILPRARDRVVRFELPPLLTLEHAPKAIAAILAAVAGGLLTPAEADELGRLVDTFARAIVAADRVREEREALDEKVERMWEQASARHY